MVNNSGHKESAGNSQSPKVSVVIPARDEALAVGGIISQLKQTLSGLPYEIILVDDGSQDGTSKIGESLGATVVSHRVNLGKGAAMKTGAEKARGEIIVFMDGDGQHKAKDLPRVLNPVLHGQADLVIGSRTLPESDVTIVPAARKWSNSFASFTISFIISFLLPLRTGFRIPLRWTAITDCTSGFRAVRRDKWQQLDLVSNGYEIETEMILEAARNRLAITEAPISCTWDARMSRLSVLKDGLRTVKLLLGKLVRSPRRGTGMTKSE
ncbi:MAG: glycosyltransferase family 2 protein [Chloroflexi bacterium]|nr:glycosyltransferase family 2 protein [Chloroflexota bacterium]